MSRVLMIGSGNPNYRRYIAAGLVGHGVDLTVLDNATRSWLEPLTTGQLVADLTDTESMLTVAAELHRVRPFDAVFTYDEAQIEGCAAVAEGLGLPGLSRATAARCRDKRAMRTAFAQSGVPSAQSVLVHDCAEATAAAERLGYPVVIKPRNLGGSIGVVRADDADAVRRFFPVAAEASFPRIASLSGVLIERYLEGPEFSVESVISDGQVQICAVTAKEVAFAPYFEEVGHRTRPAGTGPEHAALLEVVRSAHSALGVEYGATHTELRLTPDGPRMIELAARLGGDQIPRLTQLATGVDLVYQSVRALSGAQPDVSPAVERVAAIRLIYPERPGRVQRLDGWPHGQTPDWAEFVPYVEIGTVVDVPPAQFMGRLGHLIVVADDDHDLDSRLSEGLAAVVVEMADHPVVAAR